jgi:hypothetical protein
LVNNPEPDYYDKEKYIFEDRYMGDILSNDLELDVDISHDDIEPFKNKDDMAHGKKQLDQIKNKQAARRYRDRKRALNDNVHDKL